MFLPRAWLLCAWAIAGLLSPPNSLSAEEIVTLAPPRLSEEDVLEMVTCTRPMRNGGFRIEIEEVVSETGRRQIVAHCYGMGASGWSTLFGCVANVIDQFAAQYGSPEEFPLPIRVVGAGCIGLTTAIELKRLGYHVVGITAKEQWDLPSWRAGGYFDLGVVSGSPEEEERANLLGIYTFQVYQQIHRGQHPYLAPDSVRYLPSYCSEGPHSGLDGLVEAGLIPPRRSVTLDFGDGVCHPHFVEYMNYFMDTPKLMQQLRQEVARLEIPITEQEIFNFDELNEDVIFNCTGLGAQALANDDQMMGARGHLLLLKQQAGEGHMDYMICTHVEQDGHRACIYLFPKPLSVSSAHQEGRACHGCLGGTFILHADTLGTEELEQLDRQEFDKLKQRARRFFHGTDSP